MLVGKAVSSRNSKSGDNCGQYGAVKRETNTDRAAGVDASRLVSLAVTFRKNMGSQSGLSSGERG